MSDLNKFLLKPPEDYRVGILKETLMIGFSSLLFIILILLLEYKIFARLYQFIFNKFIGTSISYKDENEDPDIRGERDQVNTAKNRS